MIIDKYGIRLCRLKEKDIELVRQKRNADEIRRYMDFQEIITEEMQKKWFESVNNIYNYYYTIEHEGKKIGLINGKNIDFEKRTSEGGIFIWDLNYLGTFIPVICSVIITDLTFYINNFKKNYAKVLRANQRSVFYNQSLGYVPSKDFPENESVQYYELTRENYTKSVASIRKGIISLTKDGSPLSLENISFETDSESEINKLYKGLPPDIQSYLDFLIQKRLNHAS